MSVKPIPYFFACVGIFAGLGFFWYLSFRAYQERFPDAPAWTFFFQGR